MKRYPGAPVIIPLVASALPLPFAAAAPVINEIMYRPGTGYPENTALEFIEIHNPGTTAVDMSGWAITKGADFTFPAGTTIAAGGFLVVAPDVAAFQAAHPGVTAVAGPWTTGAMLADSGETIALARPGAVAGTFETVDSVAYADEGDWAVRTRDTLGGWSWVTGANGAGKSLERRNPLLDGDNGQNWGDSTAAGGSPGAANSLLTTNLAPLVSKVNHSPAVPKSTEAVTISCELADEAGAPAATLWWRSATTTTPGTFQAVPMTAGAGGYFSASLPAMADKTIVEFYISATDGTLSRTWPAPTSEGQNANCQYQVDNEVIAGTAPTYRLILTAAENAAFNSVNSQSNRMFNLTFVATRGDDPTIRYRASMRIRGWSSRNYTIRPLRISLPTDDRWDGITDFALNPKYPWVQFLGMRALQAAGVAGGDATPVEVRRNGVEYTVGGTSGDYGQLVRIENINSDYIDRHWPDAPGGQVYRAEGMDSYWNSTGTAPTNPDTAWNGWTKQSAPGLNDWSDVIGFCTLWQNTAYSHFTGATAGNVQSGTWNNVAFTDAEVATLETAADLDHMARWMAVMTIIQNTEPSISNGGGDDYAAAFIEDELGRRRLQLLPHDLDNVMGKGDEAKTYNGTGLYDMTEGAGGGPGGSGVFEPLLPLFGTSSQAGNAAFRTRYLTEIRRLYGSVFDADTTTSSYPPWHAFIDNHTGNWLPDAIRTQLKTFATQRQAYLLGLIGAARIVPAPTSTGTLAASFNGTLRINEVLASNATAHANGTTWPDVIELHNTGAATADLTGMSLTDDPAVPLKYVFPAGATIAAGGFLPVYADSEAAQPGLHTGFKLDAEGDGVRLYASAASGGALVDEVAFGPQATDLAIGRTAADPAVWALLAPTIGSANGNAVALGTISAVRINEWAGNTDFRLNWDFIELYNTAAAPAPIGGAALTDDAANDPTMLAFPALSFLAANGRVLLDEDTLGFKLDGNFGYLTLFGANGDLVDQVSIVSQFGDRSTGRSSDGAAGWAEWAIPSPGIANQTAPATHAALIAQLRITEILAAPSGGSACEFVELQNIGATTLDLGGVRFSDGIDYTFPAGTTLAAGAFIVVCKDRTAFLQLYPDAAAALAGGAFTGALDNSGETLALTLPAPWQVNILRFRFDPDWFAATAGSGHSLVTANQATSLPKDWDEVFTWSASPEAGGTPGSEGPPSITSAATATGVVGDAFAYQITATKFPTAYDATGLPPGLSVDTATGLISGTPAAAGTYPATVSASNTGGASSQGLAFTIGTSGPLHHFSWDWLAGDIHAGTPFAVQVTARDEAGRVVTGWSGSVNLSAASGGAGLASPVLVTEFTDGMEDQFELQNVSNAAVDTSGWYVRINDNSTGINTVHATQLALPASIAAGALVWVSETNTAPRTWWGGAINWSSSGTSKGWIMLFDNTHTLRDFAVWGWSAAELAGLNVTINGTNVTAAGNWSGAPCVVGTRGTANSWQRAGSADSNSAADFQWTTNSSTFNGTNPNLALPWTTSTPVPLSPASATFTEGVFVGCLTIPATAPDVVLTTNDGAGHGGSSAAFEVAAALADTDADGMPDAWEGAHGLAVGSNDSAADADGDGGTNLGEYLAGTDPADPASRFRLTGCELAGGDFTVSWDGVAGRVYQLSTSDSLAGAWAPLSPLVLATADGPLSVAVPAGGGLRLFVRAGLVR